MTDEYIVEAQRLSIAQNKTLKFFYQTWWAWWLPRAVIVGLMIFSLSDQPRIYRSTFGSRLSLFSHWGVVGSPEFGQSAQKSPGQGHHDNRLDERSRG